ncbi:MAG: TIGR04255 family protein [Candidatus Scalindua sp. AMX11]|nr:MAG: TIGR04255 family protein [Candidatus Scalindua sp.]NOG83809.1 TIGR04255 family protein [Planctomycetota bacterium]RZV82964.1 MAG: TIGR04255 family protein [Candidatus Scalindua sp. SCAELEC01]TDE64414.1 MAG: TIGR04255 family protein [Candidatus Scalindua sp. AMX11]GJQ59741.1 MAG: hypothetical protein SCALA701_25420 [Candidatus Scalindua sp.]
MNENGINDKNLNKNGIKNFILRIDLIKNKILDISKIADAMASYFDRAEKRQLSNFTLKFTNDDSKLTKEEVFNFVLISETKSVSMTFSEIENAFWIKSSQYRNNLIYKELIKKVIEEISTICNETEAKRIGLRYINEFKCEKISHVGQIYGKRLTTITKAMMKEENQSRVIGMEHYNNDEYKLRLQYGIPNNFYPSVITLCPLLLDIDSYTECTCNISDFEKIISDLNHAAYGKFIKEMNPKYLEELK